MVAYQVVEQPGRRIILRRQREQLLPAHPGDAAVEQDVVQVAALLEALRVQHSIDHGWEPLRRILPEHRLRPPVHLWTRILN